MVRIAQPAGIALAILALAAAGQTLAAQQQPQPAAPRITLAEAKTAVDAAEAEARRNGWNLAFVISDAEGTPIYVRRMDGVPKRNYDVAMNKISTAITSGMNTGDYVAAVRAGTIQPIEGAFMFDGGLLMRRGGQLLGAFSASGATGAQDAQAVRAGMTAIGIPAGEPTPQAPAAAPAPAAPAPPQAAGAPPAAPAAPAAPAVRLSAEVLDRYVGVYELSPNFTITVSRNGDTLYGQPSDQEAAPLHPVSETRFRVGDAPLEMLEVEFVKDESGAMYKVVRQNGQEFRARRRN